MFDRIDTLHLSSLYSLFQINNLFFIMNKLLFAFLLLSIAFAFEIQTKPTQQKTCKNKQGIQAIKQSLNERGSGITDKDEDYIITLIQIAFQKCGDDAPDNAAYIRDKMEEHFGGIWSVVIIHQPSSWGANWGALQEKYVFYFNVQPYDWTISIWKSRH